MDATDEPSGFGETLRRAQAGDASALAALMDRFARDVTQECLHIDGLGDEDLSIADLTQEIWLRVWTRLHQFRGAEDDELSEMMFRKWLRITARHALFNLAEARRAQRRKPPTRLLRLNRQWESRDTAGDLPPAAKDESPSGAARMAEQNARVQQAIARLPDEMDRTILQLRFGEGMSLRQIAERLNQDYAGLRRRFHNALRFLERELAD